MTEDVLVVDVTAEDIAQGEQGMSQSCPVALALERTRLGCWVVDRAVAYTRAGAYGVYSARGLTTFVRRFDSGKPVEPRTFRFRRIR